MHVKAGRISGRDLYFGLHAIFNKTGRVCDEELFFVFTQIKSCCSSPLVPALVLAKKLNISFRTLIKFLSEDLVTWQGLIKASFEAV